MEHAWKACGCNSLVGSNPTLSATDRAKRGASGALYLQSALAEPNSRVAARLCEKGKTRSNEKWVLCDVEV